MQMPSRMRLQSLTWSCLCCSNHIALLSSPKPTGVIEKNYFNFSGIQNMPWASNHLQIVHLLTQKIHLAFSLMEYLIKKHHKGAK